MYLIKTPWWLKKIYPAFTWNIKAAGKAIYLTFDDGPHETATPFVLDQLRKYHAKATFFCIGKNVLSQSNLYQRILEEGHAVGNHTYNHLNGWKTDDKVYINDINNAAQLINTNLFRPPYGRIKKSQAKLLEAGSRKLEGNTTYSPLTTHHSPLPPHPSPFSIIMWDVLSADFDTNLSPEKCLGHVLANTQNGSIIVFHDSTKAWDRMSYALPKVLEHFSNQGYSFKAIVQ